MREGSGSCCHCNCSYFGCPQCPLASLLRMRAHPVLAAAAADCEGHGTHVAAAVGGLTFGVAKDASLHAVRILDCDGNGAGGWADVCRQRGAESTVLLGSRKCNGHRGAKLPVRLALERAAHPPPCCRCRLLVLQCPMCCWRWTG